MLSIIGIVLGLTLLVVLALKGWNVILSALLSAFVVILFSGLDLRDALYNTFMPAFGSWGARFFLMILAGGLFAKLIEDSGAAKSISNGLMRLAGRDNVYKTMIACWLVTFFLTYVGITAWVIVFVMLPIMYPIFKKLDIPWHLALAVFSLGANGGANALPGAVILYNVMPMQYLGTSAMAGWKISMIAEPISIVASFSYIFWQYRKSLRLNERFVKPAALTIKEMDEADEDGLPHIAIALTPIIATLVVLNVFKLDAFFALGIGCICCIALMFKRIPNIIKSIADGAGTVAEPVMTTCAVVGFGSVVSSTPGYEIITNAILQGIPGSPYVSWCVGINALSGITGSASGGLAIALESLLPKYLSLGLNPEALHRLAALACIGLDSLPHNGAIVTIMMIFGLTHKEGYKHIFVNSVVITVLSCIPAIIAASIFY
jgi:H+/gluconate symporter and related permeases